MVPISFPFLSFLIYTVVGSEIQRACSSVSRTVRYLHSLSRLLTYPIYRPTSSRFNNLPFKKITPLISKPFARFKRPLSAFNSDVFPHPISIFISSSLNTCWTKDSIDSIGRIKEALFGINNDLVLVLDHQVTPHNFLQDKGLLLPLYRIVLCVGDIPKGTIGKRGGRGLHVGWRLLKTRGVHSIDCRLVPLQVVFGFVLSNKGVGEGLLSIRRSSRCRGWYRLCITIIFEEGGEKSFGVREFQISRRRIDRRTKSYEVVF